MSKSMTQEIAPMGSGVNYAPEQVLSHGVFVEHTEEFYANHRTNLLHPQARPNAEHLALTQLESRGKLSAVIAQNIDGLHQAAGSQRVP